MINMTAVKHTVSDFFNKNIQGKVFLLISLLMFTSNAYLNAYNQTPPATITLQAKFSQGDELLDGIYRVDISLYSGENYQQDWSEVHKSVNFENGFCQLRLGEINPFDPEDFEIRTPNFSILINGQETRVTLNSVPYAMRSHMTDSVPATLDMRELLVSDNLTIGINSTSNGYLNVRGRADISRDFSVSENLLIVTNNIVGIGATDLNYLLNVAGPVNVETLYINGTSFTTEDDFNQLKDIAGLSTSDRNFIVASEDKWVVVSGNAAREKLGLGELDTPAFNALYVKSLGINEKYPAGLLHIITTENISGLVTFNIFVVTNNRIGIGSLNPSATVYITGNIPLIVDTASTQNALVITGNGNVGMGGVPGDYKLHVFGDMKVEGALEASVADSDWLLSNSSAAYYNNNYDIGIGTDYPSGNFHIRTMYNTGTLKGNTLVVTRNRVGIGTTQPLSLFYLKQQDSNESELVRIDSFSGSTLMFLDAGGNVGMGISNPSARFHIRDNDIDSLVVSGSMVSIGTSNTGALLDIYAAYPQSPSSSYFRISSGDMSLFTVSKNGRIGIGTAHPEQLLHIFSDGIDSFVVNKNSTGIGTKNLNAVLDVYADQVQDDNNFYRVSDSTNTHFIIKGNGNVGIGISEPSNHLQVGVNDFVITDEGYIGVGTTKPEGSMQIVNNGNQLLIASGNKVGIGTLDLSDGDVLTLEGNMRIRNGTIKMDDSLGISDDDFNIDRNNNFVYLWQGYNLGVGTRRPKSLFHVVTSANDNPAVTVDTFIITNNYIGIGTDLPDANLHISADIPLKAGMYGTPNALLVSRNGYVGINTSVPAFNIDVSGSVNADHYYVDGNLFEIAELKPVHRDFIVGIGNSWVTRNYYDTRTVLGVGTGDSPVFNRVGISLPYPTGELHVRSTDNALSAQFDTLIVTNNRIGMGLSEPAGILHIVSTDNFSLSLEDTLVITGNKIGIGTSTPVSIFHIISTANHRNSAARLDTLVVTDNKTGLGTREPSQNMHIYFDSGDFTANSIRQTGLIIENYTVAPAGSIIHNAAVKLKVTDSEAEISCIRIAPDVGAVGIFLNNGDSNLNEVARFTPDGLGIGVVVPSGDFHVQSSVTENSFIVTSNGIAVGTTSPAGNFHVVSNYGNTLVITNNRIGAGIVTPEGVLHIVSTDNITAAKEDTVIVTANMVGLGTTRPQSLLYVSGNVVVSANLDSQNGAQAGIGINVDPDAFLHIKTHSNHQVVVSRDYLGVGVSPHNKNLRTPMDLYVGGKLVVDGEVSLGAVIDQDWSTTNHAIYPFEESLRVGIGTSAPSGNIHIVSDGVDSLIVTRSRVGIGMNTVPSASFQIVTDNVPLLVGTVYRRNALVVTSNGYVGIASSNPEVQLTVSGNVLFRGDKHPLVAGTGLIPYALVVTRSGYVGIGDNSPDEELHISGDILIQNKQTALDETAGYYFKISDDTDNLYKKAALLFKRAEDAGSARGDLYISINNDADNTNADIDDTKISIMRTGEVGIGTISPAATLNVTGNAPLLVSSGGMPNALVVTVDGRVGIATYNPRASFTVNGDVFVRGQVTPFTVLTTSNIFVVTRNGLVGLATSNPSHQLTVSGNILVSAPGPYLRFSHSSGSNQDAHGEIFFSEADDDGIKVKYNGEETDEGNALYIIGRDSGIDNIHMVIKKEGYIGIGTDIPSASLHITGNTPLLVSRGADRYAFLVDDNSYVGIGADSPAEKLVVSGNVLIDNDLYVDELMGIGTRFPEGYVHVVTSNYDVFIITDNRVGIGLVSPDAALHIQPELNISPLKIASKDTTGYTHLIVSPDGWIGVATEHRLSVDAQALFEINGTLNATNILLNGEQVPTISSGLQAVLNLGEIAEPDTFVIFNSQGEYDVTDNTGIRVNMGLATDDTVSFNRLGLNMHSDTLAGELHVMSTENGTAARKHALVVTNNRVGIGTIMPSANLHVTGDIPLLISTGATPNAFVVNGDGYIGIGTSDPFTNLHLKSNDVNGTDLIKDAEDRPSVLLEGDYPHLILKSNGQGSHGGVIGLWAYDGSTDTHQWNMDAGPDGIFQIGYAKNSPDPHTYESVIAMTAEKNVGIGTTGPRELLTVAGNSLFTGNNYVSSNIYIDGYILNAGDSHAIEIQGSHPDGPKMSFGTNTQTDSYFVIEADAYRTSIDLKSRPLTIKSDAISSILYIDNVTGLIGMAVDNPLASLHVSKNESLNPDYPPFIVSAGDTTYALAVTGNGYVGIATDSPGYELEVIGRINASDLIMVNGVKVVTNNPVLDDFSSLITDNAFSFIVASNNGTEVRWTTMNAFYMRRALGLGESQSATFNVLSVIDRAGINLHSDPVSGNFHVMSTSSVTLVRGNTLVVTDNQVGIGTAEPEAWLHIYNEDSNIESDLIIENTSTDKGDSVIKFKGTGPENLWTMGLNRDHANVFNIAYSDDLTANVFFTITPTGSIGAGGPQYPETRYHPATDIHIRSDNDSTRGEYADVLKITYYDGVDNLSDLIEFGNIGDSWLEFKVYGSAYIQDKIYFDNNNKRNYFQRNTASGIETYSPLHIRSANEDKGHVYIEGHATIGRHTGDNGGWASSQGNQDTDLLIYRNAGAFNTTRGASLILANGSSSTGTEKNGLIFEAADSSYHGGVLTANYSQEVVFKLNNSDSAGDYSFHVPKGKIGVYTDDPGVSVHIADSEVPEAVVADHLSGLIVLGKDDEENIVMDSDEIQARNNNNASALYMNPDTGTVVIGMDSSVSDKSLELNNDMLIKRKTTTAETGIYFYANNDTEGWFAGITENSNALVFRYQGSETPLFTIDEVNGPQFNSVLTASKIKSNSELSLYDTSDSGITVANNGKVGIATSNPLQYLHISATTAPAADAAIAFQNTDLDSAEGWTIGLDNDNNKFKFAYGSLIGDPLNDDSLTKVTILDDGKVGIGTANPKANLHIENGSDFIKLGVDSGYAAITLNAANGPYIDFSNDGTLYDARIILIDNDILNIEDADVGIGKSAPDARLHVEENGANRICLKAGSSATLDGADYTVIDTVIPFYQSGDLTGIHIANTNENNVADYATNLKGIDIDNLTLDSSAHVLNAGSITGLNIEKIMSRGNSTGTWTNAGIDIKKIYGYTGTTVQYGFRIGEVKDHYNDTNVTEKQYGMYIGDIIKTGTDTEDVNYGIYIHEVSGAGKNYGIYIETASANYLAGDLVVTGNLGVTGNLEVEGHISGNISATYITGTVDSAKLQYGNFMIDSAGTNGQVWMSDGSDSGTWSNGFVNRVTVSSNTGDLTLTVDDSNTLSTNEGATAEVTFTLPDAAAGLTYDFYVQDSDGLTITAVSDDTIRVTSNVTGTAGSISSSTVGDCVKLVAVNATEWVAVSVAGTGWVVIS